MTTGTPEEAVDKLLPKKDEVDDDALSALEKKAGAEDAKEIEALVSLVEGELSTSEKDLGGLLEEIGNKKEGTPNDKKKLVLNGLQNALIGSDPEQSHKEARDAAYEMLTGKKNKKKNFFQDFKELFTGGAGIMLVFKNIWKKAMGVDLKAEEKAKKALMDEFVKNNIEMLNNLKTKLHLPTIPIEPTKKVETQPTDMHENDEDVPSGDIEVKETDFKFSVPIGSPIGDKKVDIRSGVGPRNVKDNPLASHDHHGVDIAVPVGTDVMPPADGKVIKVGFQENGAGNYVDIDHGKFITRYFHLSKIMDDVKEGTIVKKNQKIAESGASGNATYNGQPHPHLHYEIRDKTDITNADKKGASKYKVLDPKDFIDVDGDGKVVAMTTYKDQLTAA